jgi:hypothetical protein
MTESREVRWLGRGRVGSIRTWRGHVARDQHGRAGSDPREARSHMGVGRDWLGAPPGSVGDRLADTLGDI